LDELTNVARADGMIILIRSSWAFAADGGRLAMTPDSWCLIGTSAITAIVVGRLLATGRESALLTDQLAKEEAELIRRQRDAVIAEMDFARSDVQPVGD
jgi:hypothetical protein